MVVDVSGLVLLPIRRWGRFAAMGAWGHGSFENDSAMDWLGQIVGGDPSIVRAALEYVVVASGHIDVDDGSVALAAAELVAAATARVTIG